MSGSTHLKSGITPLGTSPHSKLGEGGGEEEVTRRYCKARIVNKWGVDLSQVTLRHRRHNDPKKEDKGTWDLISEGGDSPDIDIEYETGFAADGDYWWIQFTAAGRVYTVKDNKYCDLRTDDQGSVVDLTVCGGDEVLRIIMRSGVCTTDIYSK